MFSLIWSHSHPFDVMLVCGEARRRGEEEGGSMQPSSLPKPTRIPRCSAGCATAGDEKASRRRREPRTRAVRCLRCHQLTAVPAWGRTLPSQQVAPEPGRAGRGTDGCTDVCCCADAGSQGRVKGTRMLLVEHPAVQQRCGAEPLGLGGVRLQAGHTGRERRQGTRAGRAAAWHGAGRSRRLQLAPGREEPDLVSCD